MKFIKDPREKIWLPGESFVYSRRIQKIKVMAKVDTKIPLQEAKNIASEIMDKLEPHFTKALVTGSIRRGIDEIGDIDIAVIPKDTLRDNVDDIMEVTNDGKKQIFGTFKGRPINLFLTDDQSWGAQIMASTGPAQYNIRKRFLVKRKGLKLNQYGLFNAKSGEYLAGKTEKNIYDYLGWSNTTPSERK